MRGLSLIRLFRFMTTISRISLWLLFAVFFASAQQKESLEVRKTSPATVRVNFQPQFIHNDVRTATGTGFTYVSFVGAVLPPGNPGSWMIPYRAIPLTLSGRPVSVRVVEAKERRMANLKAVPYPRWERDEEFGAASVFEEKGENTAGTANLPIAEIIDVGPRGSAFQATLAIRPVRPGNDGTITVFDRLVIEVDVGQASVSTLSARRALSSPLQNGEWYTMSVRETGIYKLDRSFFSNANISSSSIGNINSVRIFGNGGASVPENSSDPRVDGLQEVSRFVWDDNNNGVFDPEDCILFYGRAPNGWTYNPAARTYTHWINYYTDSNIYFLTFGGPAGRQMDSVGSISSPAPFEPGDFQGMLFVEEERNNLIHSGRQWFGQFFDSETQTGVYANLLEGFVSTKPVVYRISVLARSLQSGSFTVEENGVNLGGPIFTVGIDVNSIENNYAYRPAVATYARTGTLPGDRSALRLTFVNAHPLAVGWLDWIEILYRRRFEAVSDFISFHSPDTSAKIRYAITGFSSRDVIALDVTDHANVKRITGLTFDPLDPGKCSFEVADTAGSTRTFAVAGPNGFKSPGPLNHIDNSDLHGITAGAEMVIIAPKEFRSEADRLAGHRAQDGLSVLVVNSQDIQNEYGGGLQDPLAVRDFLVDSQAWATKPRYVLLFGNGHYDYKNIRSTSRNWIPPYESLESVNQIDTFASDDAMAKLIAGNNRVTVAIGRLPVNSPDEARSVVDKIMSYEASASFDPWRNRVLFVADDGMTSTKDEGSIHTNQAEVLAQSYTPSSVEKKKIYIVQFPTVNSSSGRRKPAANAAIIDAINRGSLVVNYTGHGNPQQWAHEAIFTREGSLPQLANADRLFLLVAATCDFARYDNPAEQSAGEKLLTMSSGGAVGVVTASRAVYSFENSQFNNLLYTNLFVRDSLGRSARLGDAMFETKQMLFDTNDLKYHLFADPAMRLNLPPEAAVVDSINGSSPAGVVTVQALSRILLEGEIKHPDGSVWTDFNGQLILEVFDAKRGIPVPEWQGFSFEQNGSLLYRGLISVAGGLFNATVPIPKDVSYNNNRSRISVYAWSGTSDAVGFTDGMIIAGTDSTAVADTTGPQIQVFLEDESFRSGDVVPPNPLLIVRLFDQNGINTSTASIGHRLEAVLHATSQHVDLAEVYRGDQDTYQSGVARYSLQNLPEGRQTMTVRAWDIYNNSSSTDLSFDVRLASDLSMYQVFNFPNPISQSTVFTFQRNSSEPIDVTVKIYTVTGRFVAEVKSVSVLDRFVRIPWDARDRNGDVLANGVYFYKVVTNSLDRQMSREALGKLTVLR